MSILNSRILIIDDDENLCYLLKEELIDKGFFVDFVHNGFDGLKALDEINYNLVLLDLQMLPISGYDTLREIKKINTEIPIIVLTGLNDIRTAVDCIKEGAYDFITKPYQFNQLEVSINRALEFALLRTQNKILLNRLENIIPTKIIGESPKLKETLKFAEKAAQSDANILIEGETGTGKELLAEFIHQSSPRNSKPFVIINCASLPDQLLESELFGYEKGAFTDAKSSKQGLVEVADGGTLFLDEIGELSLSLQPKLLRFLENGEFRRLGGVQTRKANVRIIGATNRNLLDEVEKKTFRRDLLFRLNVITIEIPPLRERGNDILAIAEFFLERKGGKNKKTLSEIAKRDLLNYEFWGNVRELAHIIERALIFSETDEIQSKDLNLASAEKKMPPQKNIENSQTIITNEFDNLPDMEEIEKFYIQKRLAIFNWNREETARSLGISQKTLYTKIKNYGISQ